MKNGQEVKSDSTLFSFYSPKYLHMIVEFIFFLILMLYVRRSHQRLQNQILDLKSIIQKQQEMLHHHQQLLKMLFPNEFGVRQNNIPINHPSKLQETGHPVPSHPVSPPLPPFEAIATIFNVPMGNEPEIDLSTNDGSTTIIDKSNGVVLDEAISNIESNIVPPAEQLEKELEKEMMELKQEEMKNLESNEQSISTSKPVEEESSPSSTSNENSGQSTDDDEV